MTINARLPVLALLLLMLNLSLAATANAADKPNAHTDAAREMGDLVVAAIKSKDFSRLDKHFDNQGFAAKVVELMQVSPSEGRNIQQQIVAMPILQNMLGQTFKWDKNNEVSAKVIAVLHNQQQLLAVVRINLPQGGSNYYELNLKFINGRYYIADIFLLANGQYISETLAQSMAMLQSQPSGWLATLVGEKNSREHVLSTMKKTIAYRNKGDFANAYKSLKELPEPVRQQELVQLMNLMIASHLGETIYRQELSDFAKHHGNNPRYYFMLIDHYFYQEEYDLALNSIEKMLQRYPSDASLLTLKANVLLAKKEFAKAQSAINAATLLEPDFEDAYWSGVTTALHSQQFNDAILLLKQYEQQFNYNFTRENFSDQEIYADLILSREFNRWMKTKEL